MNQTKQVGGAADTLEVVVVESNVADRWLVRTLRISVKAELRYLVIKQE